MRTRECICGSGWFCICDFPPLSPLERVELFLREVRDIPSRLQRGERFFWTWDYCDGPIIRIWWLGYVALTRDMTEREWYQGWGLSLNLD